MTLLTKIWDAIDAVMNAVKCIFIMIFINTFIPIWIIVGALTGNWMWELLTLFCQVVLSSIVCAIAQFC